MLQVVSPYDLSLIKEIPMHGQEELEAALSIAYDLFLSTGKWIPAHERIAILQRAAVIMEGRIDELTATAASEGGKPLMDSKVEVLRAINGVQIAAQSIGQLKGEHIPMGMTKASENRLGFTTREPIGVVASISAFNHPLNLIVHQVVTAFAAGCPVIVKPALTTPLSCIALIDILKEAGVPEGWCQVLICTDVLAEKLATDSRVNYLSFIGSAKVGWYLRSKLAPGTRCALEHGGAAPVIVESDANIEEMLPALAKGGFYHAGQVCVSVQRVYVHESIVKEVADGLTNIATKLIVGDQMNPDTEVGPLILPREVDRVEQWANEAIEGGATLLTGGKRISNTCYEPTILLNPSEDAKVSTLEIFGPVICIYSFTDRNEAIKRANRLDVHFQASVFTENINIALDCVKQLNAAAVMVNDHTAFRVDWMPFGGRDASGIGVGGIQYTMNEMTREKLTVIKSSSL